MRTMHPELDSEAGIYAEGTHYHGRDLARQYDSYANAEEEAGRVPDDFQRWIKVAYPECCA